MHISCCVCGEWGPEGTMAPIDADVSLERTIRRRYIVGTLLEKHLCKDCKATCGQCGAVITVQQRRQFDRLCAPCSFKKNPPAKAGRGRGRGRGGRGRIP